jgi:hypothetical protein
VSADFGDAGAKQLGDGLIRANEEGWLLAARRKDELVSAVTEQSDGLEGMLLLTGAEKRRADRAEWNCRWLPSPTFGQRHTGLALIDRFLRAS